MNNDQVYKISRSELAYLAKTIPQPQLIGFPKDYLSYVAENPSEIEKGLLDKQLLVRAEKFFLPEPKFRMVLGALLTPEKTLILIRDRAKMGKQRAIFVKSQNHFILHVQSSEDEHVLQEVVADKILGDVLSWLQVSPQNKTLAAPFRLQSQTLEKVITAAEQGQVDEANKLLSEVPDRNVAADFIQAIQNRTFSTSLALLDVNQGEAKNASSFTIIASEPSAWNILPTAVKEELLVEKITQGVEQTLVSVIESFTGNFTPHFQTFTLTLETLAYCLALINRPELSQEFLVKQYAPLTSEKLGEIYKNANSMLLKANLCTNLKNGAVYLDPGLEKALFPIAKHDFILQTDIVRPNFQSFATVYSQSKGQFCSMIKKGTQIYLEYGDSRALANYLFLLYQDFGLGSTETLPDSSLNIHFDTLMSLVDQKDAATMPEGLNAEALPEEVKQMLWVDFKHRAYRASIRQIASERSKSDATLLLLKGDERNWLFKFASTDNNPLGSVLLINRDQYMKEVQAYLASN